MTLVYQARVLLKSLSAALAILLQRVRERGVLFVYINRH